MSKRYLVIFIILIIALIGSVTLVLRTTVFINKATVDTTVVLENSYLFASPIQAKADGLEKVRLTIFLLDGRGLGVPNQTVTINVSPLVTLQESQNVTDESGKAIFDLSSSTNKTFNVSAQVGNKTLPQQVKIVFY